MDKVSDVSQRFVVDGSGQARITSMSHVADRLRDCLEELDRLEVWGVGAHVSQALSDLEVEICASV